MTEKTIEIKYSEFKITTKTGIKNATFLTAFDLGIGNYQHAGRVADRLKKAKQKVDTHYFSLLTSEEREKIIQGTEQAETQGGKKKKEKEATKQEYTTQMLDIDDLKFILDVLVNAKVLKLENEDSYFSSLHLGGLHYKDLITIVLGYCNHFFPLESLEH